MLCLILIVIILIISIISYICYVLNKDNFTNKTSITFIIPTIGRKTLNKTINSILNQTNPNWKIIIIFDGVEPNININDSRISIIKINKKGTGKNSAGNVRNEGLKLVNTEWVGFVDDDDILSKNYIKYLQNDSFKYSDVNAIIFRMRYKDGKILPKKDDNNFFVNEVGISFAVKTNFYKYNNLYFEPSNIEDFIYLDKIRNTGSKMLISSNVAYFIEHDEVNTNKFKEVLIN